MSASNWMPGWMPQRPELREGERKWPVKLLLAGLALVLTLLLLATPVQAIAGPNSSEGSEPVIELSTAEADSLLDLVDDQGLHIKLLKADLWEARALAANDSTLAAKRLELTEQAYERILQAYKDDRDNWLERLVKKPVVWLALGLYLGVQAN